MSKSNIDFNDRPLSFNEVTVKNFDETVTSKDILEIKDYAKALATFIADCDTPMTIGVQGDWGIGKTSLLNTIKAYLESENRKKNSKNFGMIWINTWHYSMFGQDEYLGLSVIKGILEQLKTEFQIEDDVPAMGRALSFAKNLIKNAQITVGGVSLSAKDADSDTNTPKYDDVSFHMKGFKQALEELIESIVVRGHGIGNVDRIVFFIDDLDRVKPSKALELLEVLKNFMDIEHCVFVLAVDYEVVQMGMEQKYGVDLQKKSGKSFFDKIIQLPFMMPSTSYNLAGYIQRLLNDAKIKVESDEEAQFYDDITTLTVGRNPRSVKRVVNYAKLIRIIRDNRASRQERDSSLQRRIIYALVCMQIAWPEIFAYFAKSATESTIKQIENWDEQKNIPFINKLYDRTPNLDQLKSNISAYFDLLFELLDNDLDGSLGESELKPLWDALYVAKLTTVTDFKEPFDIFRDMVMDNSSNRPEVKAILADIYKSKWTGTTEIQFVLSGKRYVTIVYQRKQIGSFITLKNRPLIFRLDFDDQDIRNILVNDFSEDELNQYIYPIEEQSLTGFGRTLIDLSKVSQNTYRVNFMNRLFKALNQLIKA